MPTRRRERVARRIVQEMVEALRGLKHVKLGFITVTRCEVSPDLRHAKIFISVFADEAEQGRNLLVIRQNASKLRGMIARPLGMKIVPQLHFELDETIAAADRMSRLITDARATDSNPAPLTPEEAAELSAGGMERGRKRKVSVPAGDADPDSLFDEARLDVDDELLGEQDAADWKPINLDELPDDG